MRKYPAENWKLFGASVHDLRMRQGYRDMRSWSDAVGRSDRVLLGLERGEPVGAKTIEAIAKALGYSEGEGYLFALLADGPEIQQEAVRFRERDHEADYEGYVSGIIGDAIGTLAGGYDDPAALKAASREILSRFSDNELVSEIAARLARSEPRSQVGSKESSRPPEVSELDRARSASRSRDQELSEGDASLSPAALDTTDGLDEEPGGSELDES